MDVLDLTNLRFGRWMVISKIETNIRDYTKVFWKCKCDCGVIRNVRGILLRKPKNGSKSCGCARSDTQKRKPNRRTHGFSKDENLKINILYHTWKTMRQRCMNPNSRKYSRYGGRGIYVCERWNDFTLFLEDMGSDWQRGLSLDRILNDGPYSKENCRWVENKIQANNKGNNLVIVNINEFTDDELKNWKRNEKLSFLILNIFNVCNISSKEIEFVRRLDKNSAIFTHR